MSCLVAVFLIQHAIIGFLDLYGLIKLGFKSQSKITRKLVILDVYDGSQGRHPKRDLKPRFISPYPFKNPI